MDTLPTGDEIAKLPMQAIVNFAVRCARRALPIYSAKYPHDRRVLAAIEISEKYAADITNVDAMEVYAAAGECGKAAKAAAKNHDKESASAANTASNAAIAATGVGLDAAEADIAVNAEAAAQTAVEAGVDISGIREDYERMLDAS